MEKELVVYLDRIVSLANKNKLKSFNIMDSDEKINENFDKFLTWQTNSLQRFEDIVKFASFKERKVMPVYVKHTDSDPVYITTNSVFQYFTEENSHIQIPFNCLHTGNVEELDLPTCVNNPQENLWETYPPYKCCPDCYVQPCYRNSLVLTSKGFVTMPHEDSDTPGTTVVSVHKGRKLWLFLSQDLSGQDINIETFFKCMSLSILFFL